QINFADYSKLAGDWQQTQSLYDLDGDEDIDFNDLRVFAENWLAPPPSYPGYELVWSDEFYGSRINYENWSHQLGDGTAYGLPAGWGNNEREYYTPRPENSYVSNGNLVIVARQESYQGASYTSARLRSFAKQDFLYGKIEARIKLPGTQGIWPAFWMLPTDWEYGGWAASGEIDIVESTNIADTIHGTIHYGGQWPSNTSSGGSYSDGNDFSDDFHTYAIEWEPTRIRWYIDEQLYHTETSWWSSGGSYPAPFNKPFHILLNVAVGGNWPGDPNESSTFPQQMLIDYVRLYEKIP
ncbi:MAG: glycoside hydrolase family 16 protein, partial [Planctomycetota bacterium]